MGIVFLNNKAITFLHLCESSHAHVVNLVEHGGLCFGMFSACSYTMLAKQEFEIQCLGDVYRQYIWQRKKKKDVYRQYLLSRFFKFTMLLQS